ncbi:hypothetical protein JCM8547_005519 [Rhodosporidiobolus lusitaniae]
MDRAENVRQAHYNEYFTEIYQYILLAVFGALIVRNVVLRLVDLYHVSQLSLETTRSPSLDEKGGTRPPSSSTATRTYKAPLVERVDPWAFHPVVWQLNPVKLFFIAAVIGVNLPFLVVVSTSVKPPKSTYLNVPHAVALRAGFMALAQSPAVFALMGRNSIVSWLTGLSYQTLRFAHKVFALVWIGLGVVHWLGMTFSNFTWAGYTGVVGLYSMDIARYGILALLGLVFIGLFSIPWFRRRQYQIWLLIHQAMAIVILVGVYYHAPPLHHFTYASIALWAFERLLRLLQFFSLNLLLKLDAKKPLVKARATLVHGAIVLRVPNKKGNWGAGQHAYIGFPSFSKVCWQSHPFSIANVPSSSFLPSPSPSSPSPSCASPENEMLFILRVQRGMTTRLAQRLSRCEDSTEEVWVAVEGPYGGARREVGRYEEVVLVAAGSGITHVMSVLADAIQKVQAGESRTTSIHLIWIIQHVEQSSWLVSHLTHLAALSMSLPNLTLHITFHPTRGRLTPQLSRLSLSSLDALRIERQAVSAQQAREGGRKGSLQGDQGVVDELRRIEGMGERVKVGEGGRPDVRGEVRRVVQEAVGATLVVACGPLALLDDVRLEVAHLKMTHPVTLDCASYSY